jgi:exodeoxyribonuclease V
MKITTEKKLVLEKIVDWLKDKNRPQYITLGGYAGTGKTTLIAIIRRIFHKKNSKIKIGLVSYTGKATRVLDDALKTQEARFKQDHVGTIHSLIYAPIVNKSSDITGWKKKDSIDVKLIIVDEASMVDYQLWQDLLSFNIPIIAIGDHGQLPPVEGKFNLMEDPDLKLEIIYRQAAHNPIIELSIEARTKGEIAVGKYGKHVEKIDQYSAESQERVQELLEKYDEETLILTGYNHTRVKINNFIRQHKFFEPTEKPMVGDKVICLKNNHIKKIYNGMIGTITHIEVIDDDAYYAEIDLDEISYKGDIYKPQFGSNKTLNFTKGKRKKIRGLDLFDFGYALTVHKAQGSQSKRVILFEERFKQMDDDQWRRWLYTGITRAEKELYIIGK